MTRTSRRRAASPTPSQAVAGDAPSEKPSAHPERPAARTARPASKRPALDIELPDLPPVAPETSKWKDTQKWFWLIFKDPYGFELVKSTGQTHKQGPFTMVEFISQTGSVKACTVEYFEANSRSWRPGETHP